MAKHKEGKVEDYLAEQVEKHGGTIRKARWLCRRGCPDRYVSFPGGRQGFVEVKAPGLPLQSHQAREIERLRAAGTTAVVVDNYDAIDLLVAGWRKQ
jgi:Holliday junction resolvase-like predicted endonuclease